MEGDGHCDKLYNVLQTLQKRNTALHAAFARDKAARAKTMLEISITLDKTVGQKKRVEKLMRCSAKKLSEQEESVASNTYTEDP